MRETTWLSLMLIVVIGILSVVTVDAWEVLQPDGAFNAWDFSGVCPGMRTFDGSDAERTKLTQQTLAEHKQAGCRHILGYLALELASKERMDAFMNEKNNPYFSYNTTRSITDFLVIRLGNNNGPQKLVDLYGLSYVGAHHTHGLNGHPCGIIIEHKPKTRTDFYDGGVLMETLDVRNLTICGLYSGEGKMNVQAYKFNATAGVGIRITGIHRNGSLNFANLSPNGGEMLVRAFKPKCLAKGRTSMIDNHFRYRDPEDECCPEECDSGCFYETDLTMRKGTPRWRCSKCKPTAEGKPRFWNDYNGRCEACEHSSKLGLVCHTIPETPCPAPLVKTQEGCALHCKWNETLNIADGSCIPCPWTFDSQKVQIGKIGCDMTCPAFGSVNTLSFGGMFHFGDRFIEREPYCRIITGNVEFNPSTLAISKNLKTNVKVSVFYGKVRIRGFDQAGNDDDTNFLKNVQQIVGDVVVKDSAELKKLDLDKLTHLQGTLTIENAPKLVNSKQLMSKAKEAHKKVKASGLLWTTTLMTQSHKCHSSCPEDCGPGPTQSSWACKECTGNFVNERNLFSCVDNPGIGYWLNDKSQWNRCHPSCVGGCSGVAAFVGQGGCNKCMVYVAKGDKFECLFHAKHPRCDNSEKCPKKLESKIPMMIAALKPFAA
ncbi:hypothetical protein M3Y94_00665300 [Aphelenchoides besseyi]|nr:hypothetical protein M3Y94_00665300 [Aphelenchoides besseyi]KAI6231275.1 hypothetical protein M3Y95_00364300 [Aphelenchoides besseyi]